MKGLAIIAAIGLGSCATPPPPAFNQAALPHAIAQVQVNIADCDSRGGRQEFHSTQEYVGCLIAATNVFLREIQFRDDYIAGAYAYRARLLGTQIDEGTVAPSEFAARYKDIVGDLMGSVVQEQADADNEAAVVRARNQAAAAALSRFGQALKDADTPATPLPQSPTLYNCRDRGNGRLTCNGY